MNRKGKRGLKKKSSSLAVLISFVFLSLLVVILLEFINYKKGGESFIFTGLLKKERELSPGTKFNHQFLDYLNSGEFSFDYFKDTGGRYHFKIDIERNRFKEVLKKVKGFSQTFGLTLIPIEVRREEDVTTCFYRTDFNETTTHFLLFNWTDPAGKPVRSIKDKRKSEADITNPRLAIIIDDIGAYNIGAYELKKLGIPITASVLPDSPHAAEEAKWLQEYGLKTLIHLPMQPKREANNGNGQPGVITISSSREDIKRLIDHSRKIIPNAEGINNHQGSLVTSDKEMMRKILEVIKEKGLYFIDSKTDFDSIAFKTALEMRIKTAKRDIFLDHTRSYDHSLFQIRRLVEVAKKTGKGIAIGHPFETTLAAISDSIGYIKKSGVRIVFVNELLE